MLGYGIIAIISLIVVGFLVFRAYSFDKTLKSDAVSVPAALVTVNLKIDYGQNKIATFSAIKIQSPATALTIIQSAATANNLNLVTEVKPMGTLIKSINGLEAVGGYFWLTYVNGIVTPSGVDSIPVSNSDLVEFKYNKL